MSEQQNTNIQEFHIPSDPHQVQDHMDRLQAATSSHEGVKIAAGLALAGAGILIGLQAPEHAREGIAQHERMEAAEVSASVAQDKADKIGAKIDNENSKKVNAELHKQHRVQLTKVHTFQETATASSERFWNESGTALGSLVGAAALAVGGGRVVGKNHRMLQVKSHSKKLES
jgi:hypothetical protein